MHYRQITKVSLLSAVVVSFLFLCGQNTATGNEKEGATNAGGFTIGAKIAKWFDNHAAAVSINFDISASACSEAIYAALNRSLPVDVEMVTLMFVDRDKSVFRDLESYSAQGVHFFGHGHRHDITYDSITYDSAFAYFDTCFRLMKEWNLSPMAYAYPGGSGRLARTQKAVEDAGFICGRSTQGNQDSLFICADDRMVPEKWFCLPAVCIGNLPGFVSDHAGMIDLFEKNLAKKSWLIPMYHSLGFPNDYAYYTMEDYLRDLDYLRKTDSWVDHMDVVARYIRERSNCRISCVVTGSTEEGAVAEAVFQDTVNTAFELVPLTILMEVNGDRPFNRCEVMDGDGTRTVYRIVDNRFSINAVPDGRVVRMRFFEAAEE